MKIVIEAESKEMVDFILELQNQPNKTIELITNSLDDVKISRIWYFSSSTIVWIAGRVLKELKDIFA